MTLKRTVVLEFECQLCGDRQVIEPPDGSTPIQSANANARFYAKVDGKDRVWSMDLCDRCYVVMVRSILQLKKVLQAARPEEKEHGKDAIGSPDLGVGVPPVSDAGSPGVGDQDGTEDSREQGD